jgi:hypothetical protein
MLGTTGFKFRLTPLALAMRDSQGSLIIHSRMPWHGADVAAVDSPSAPIYNGFALDNILLTLEHNS